MKGLIYKLVCNKTQLTYFGSTKENYLCIRLAKHRNNYKRYLSGHSGFCNSFKVLEHDCYTVTIVKELSGDDTNEDLLNYERYYIENFYCVNKNIPNRSKDEYRLILKKRRDIVKMFKKLPQF